MMHQRVGYSAWFAILISLVAVVAKTSAFTPSSPITKSCGRHGRSLMMSSIGNNEGLNPAQKKQEQKLEMSSISGAEEIKKIDIEERTKRAMLAEAVEDRIFDLVDELDLLVRKSGGLENLTDEARDEAVEMAKQTKALQIQYDDLVNGRPSQMLEMEMEGTTVITDTD